MNLGDLYRAARRLGLDEEEAARLSESTERHWRYRLRRGGKECATCRETKPVRAFGVDSRERDGLNRVCRACRGGEAALS